MDFEDVQIHPDVTLEVVLRYLRRFDELPSQTDQLFVVDRDERLLGVLPINALIVNDPDKRVDEIMQPPSVKLLQHEKAETRGERVRALRPGQRAGRGHQRSARRSRHRRQHPGLRARARAGGGAGAGRPARRGGRLRVGLALVPQPLGVAGDQPGDGVRRVARHRRVRGHDREARRARCADADRRRHRRQLGQPDDDDAGARDGARSGQRASTAGT